MATLENIRKRTGLLLVFVGVSIALFVLTDNLGNSGQSAQDITVGEVYGEKISSTDYEKSVNSKQQIYRELGYDKQANFQEIVRNQVWNDIVTNKIYSTEYENMGLSLTKNEVEELFYGENMSPQVFQTYGQYFQDSLGMFDVVSFRAYVDQMENGSPEITDDAARRQLALQQAEFNIQKQAIVRNYMRSKFNALISKGLFVSTLEAKNDYEEANTTLDFEYVYKPFYELPDSLVNVTDEDVKAYYNKHKSDVKWKQKSSRKFAYVEFPIKASEKDRNESLTYVQNLVNDFKASTNDTIFVESNSDNSNFVLVDFNENTFNKLDTTTTNNILSAEKGAVFGPFEDNDAYKIVKVENNGKIEKRKASHILINADVPEAEAALLLDSLKKEIKNGASFAELAKTNSQGPSASKGGDLGWFEKGRMVKPFSDAVYSGNVGDLEIVKTQFGTHLVSIVDIKDTNVVRLAVVKRKIIISDETMEGIYNKANQISNETKDGKSLEEVAKENKMFARQSNEILLGATFVSGMNDSKQFIRWSFKHDLGDVSEPMNDNDDKFVVISLVKATDEGEPKFEDVDKEMRVALVKEKKATMLKEEMNNADLVALAKEVNKVVKKSNGTTLKNPYISGASNEPAVVATISTLDQGEVSTPLVGESGIFVVKLLGKTTPQEQENYTQNKTTMLSLLRNRSNASVNQALINNADVKDERLLN